MWYTFLGNRVTLRL